MTLDAFKASGILSILTPAQAIDMFRKMLAKAPVEHFMMMLPPGLPPAKFMQYAELFANEVMQAFRSEEHTSELQSLMRISYAVFCLKKKNKHNTKYNSQR